MKNTDKLVYTKSSPFTSFGVNFFDSNSKNVETLKNFVYTYGAVPVAICADRNFDYYKSGIWSSSCKTGNHAVVIVGYGSNYWLIRNSWGASWGNKGYVNVAMGKSYIMAPAVPLIA